MIKRVFSIIGPFHIAITALVLILSWYTIFGQQGLYRLVELRKINKGMGVEIASLKNQIEEREGKMALFGDSLYLETVVRQELGYVKPGEVIFQLSPVIPTR